MVEPASRANVVERLASANRFELSSGDFAGDDFWCSPPPHRTRFSLAHQFMRIGLIRHFPVEQRFPRGWKTMAELHPWRQQYEASPAILGQADLGSFQWTQCLSSDMERAVATAKAVFPGPVEQTTLLREADFEQFRTGDLRLPVWAWRWILRLSWATGHKSQRACRNEFRRRVVATADLLEARTGDVLVVSHAGMMAYLGAEFRRRGFEGPKLRMPKHATLHIYEKNSVPRLAAMSSGEHHDGGKDLHESEDYDQPIEKAQDH